MKVTIFEDEMHNAERLSQLLRQCRPDIEITGVIASVTEGLQWMREDHPADLMFMDIQLSDGNCFEMFSQAQCERPSSSPPHMTDLPCRLLSSTVSTT